MGNDAGIVGAADLARLAPARSDRRGDRADRGRSDHGARVVVVSSRRCGMRHRAARPRQERGHRRPAAAGRGVLPREQRPRAQDRHTDHGDPRHRQQRVAAEHRAGPGGTKWSSASSTSGSGAQPRGSDGVAADGSAGAGAPGVLAGRLGPGRARAPAGPVVRRRRRPSDRVPRAARGAGGLVRARRVSHPAGRRVLLGARSGSSAVRPAGTRADMQSTLESAGCRARTRAPQRR